ncbi:hypothetical protein FHN55_17910, partial [Streptomyces sp. NP160]
MTIHRRRGALQATCIAAGGLAMALVLPVGSAGAASQDVPPAPTQSALQEQPPLPTPADPTGSGASSPPATSGDSPPSLLPTSTASPP